MVWAGLIFLVAPAARAQMMSDGIAAVVNDKVITYIQIEDQVSEQVKLLQQNYSGEELFQRVKEAKLNILRALIERELIIQNFKNDIKGFIPDSYVNSQIDDIIRKDYGGDRLTFIKTLYARGMTMQKFRDTITDNTIVSFMRSKNVEQTIIVSPYQIEQYYQQNLRLFQQDEQIKVATIAMRKSVFPAQSTDTDGKQVTYDPQEKIAEEILYKLDTGANFADMAKAFSEASNKDDGGELGWVTQDGKTAIQPELWSAIARLQPGQHSDVITTADGYYYILQVEDRKKSEMTSLEDVRAQIERTVISEQSQIRQQEWLDSLRAKAFIKMFL